VVLARGEERGDRRLVAWVVPEGEAMPEVSALRAALGDRLPDYMVPSAFVPLERLPMTAAGKIDRRALPEPDWSRPELEAGYVAPRTDSEEALAEIVRELLGLDRVGVYDSFFDLGGHSLLATQFLARIRELFEVEVPLRAVFEQPTVANLAMTVEEMVVDKFERMDNELLGLEPRAEGPQ
jgi:acyl carrier protein